MSTNSTSSTTPAPAGDFPVLSPPTFSGKAEDWTAFSKRFEWYRQASGLASQPQPRQISTLMYILGEKADNLLMSFKLTDEEKHDYSKVYSKFHTHYTGTHNKIHARANFNKLCQNSDERIDDFIGRVYSAAEGCRYPDNIKDELIRDRIIVGIKDIKLSNTLQLDPNITLSTVLTKIKQAEEVLRHQCAIRPGTSSEEIDAVQGNFKTRVHQKLRYTKSCGNCGKSPSHPVSACPAKNSMCTRCKRRGHWAQKCRAGNTVNQLEETLDKQSQDEYYFMGTLGDEIDNQFDYIVNSDPWRVNLRVENGEIIFKIDSGADVTAIGEDHFKRLNNIVLTPTKSKLRAAAQGELVVKGKFKAEIIWKNKIINSEIFVIKKLDEPLLGKPAIEALGLINRIDCVSHSLSVVKKPKHEEGFEPHEEFPELFRGLGKLKGEYEICLIPNAKPFAIVCPRRVAIPLYDALRKELQVLQEHNVIFPIEKPTEYCAGIVVRPKEDGNIRLCVDYTELNKNVCRARLQLPSVDECLAQIRGARYYSKLDANKGYFQLPLEAKSRLLTTFLTPFGRFAFNRMPMGIACASEVFQKKMQNMIEGIEGVICCQDDILITGRTLNEHDSRLKQVLKRMSDEGVTLNKNKCQFRVQECTFLGHWITKNGIKPCRDKIEAILNMPNPTDISTVRSLLGMIHYHLKFLPNLATLTKPLRDLIKVKGRAEGDKSITWSIDCENAFKIIKQNLTKPNSLALFDPKKKIRVSADASSYGLGGLIEQYECEQGIWKPISFASRTLTPAEFNYAQIDKEALALTWACEKFSMYLIGLPGFELRTDHQPLVRILDNKPIADLNARMQRFRVRLSRFTYRIVHVPGKYLHSADLLSRVPVPLTQSYMNETEETEEKLAIIAQIKSLPMSDCLLEEVRRAQEEDDVCYVIKEYILSGWPDKRILDDDLQPFYSYRGDIGLQNNLIMRGHRLFIPKKLQKDFLQRLHQGHLGVEKCRRRARDSVWWPGLSSIIRTMIQQCPECIEHRRNPAEPLITSEVAKYPWEMVAIDLFSARQKEYLAVIDFYSRFPEIATLTSTTSSAIIVHLKVIFARFGVPRIVRTDNGPQFDSTDFKKFSKDWGFTHITSSPHTPWSNGMAEAGVKILKNIVLKCQEPILGLMAYRSAPGHDGYSPAQLLFGRRIRTNIPTTSDRLIPECPDLEVVDEKRQEAKIKTKINYDRRHNVKDLPQLVPGSRVWDSILCTYATVLCKRNEPRSYNLKTEKGNLIRRNRRHLVSAKESDDKKESRDSSPIEYDCQEGEVRAETRESSPEFQDCEDQPAPYMTRSGRHVRPPARLDI